MDHTYINPPTINIQMDHLYNNPPKITIRIDNIYINSLTITLKVDHIYINPPTTAIQIDHIYINGPHIKRSTVNNIRNWRITIIVVRLRFKDTVRRFSVTKTAVSLDLLTFLTWPLITIRVYSGLDETNKQTPWSESASELHRPSDRRLSAKWLLTFADRGCHVVSVTDSYGRILGFLDRSRYFSIK
jgi:hypothetical protein